MNREFLEFARGSALRATSSPGRVGHLVLTQTTATSERKLREPELRHALAQEAEARSLLYGVEVPTFHTYRFVKAPGDKQRAARTDFALLQAGMPDYSSAVLVELKEGQPGRGTTDMLDCPAIRKDFEKLLREPATFGKAIIHICHAWDGGTIPGVLEKYNMALREAVLRVPTKSDPEPWTKDKCWFELLVLVLHRRGKDGSSMPCLQHQSFTGLDAADCRVTQGPTAFDLGGLEDLPL